MSENTSIFDEYHTLLAQGDYEGAKRFAAQLEGNYDPDREAYADTSERQRNAVKGIGKTLEVESTRDHGDRLLADRIATLGSRKNK